MDPGHFDKEAAANSDGLPRALRPLLTAVTDGRSSLRCRRVGGKRRHPTHSRGRLAWRGGLSALSSSGRRRLPISAILASESALPTSQLGVEAFRAAYRALLETLLSNSTVGLDGWSQRRSELLDSPLDLAASLFGLRLSFVRRGFRALAERVAPDERPSYEAAARQVIHELIPSPSGHQPGAGWPSAWPESSTGAGMEGGLLGAESFESADAMMASAPAAMPAPSAPAPSGAAAGEPPARIAEPRFLNAAIADHDATSPLAVSAEYLLEVWIGLETKGDASARVPDASVTHRPDEDAIELTVQVTSADFSIAQDALPLKLPRRGPSAGKARFDIVPQRAGRGTLDISVHKEGNFLLQMHLTYSVGEVDAAPASVKVSGRKLDAAAQLQSRELGMTIKPVTGGYECVVRGAVHTAVMLPVTEAALADAVKSARDAMMSVVTLRDEGRALVFQLGTEFARSDALPNGGRVAAESQARALAILARAGALLFRAIFFGPAAGAEVKKVGELLRRLATRPDQRLTLQIVAERFPVPWALLYMGSVAEGEPLDWDLFLGMRHVIEQIPLQTDMLVDDTVIASDRPGLAVGVNVHAGIDAQMKLDVVARQLDYWSDRARAGGQRLTVTQRQSRGDILRALRGDATDQLMYLYCHAVTNGPSDAGGIKGSCLVFTGDERLSLADLDLETGEASTLPGNPLVFLNACESGELRAEFYDGFIPYFMARGARGVVGTECQTPAIFASEWAMRFFPRFLAGEPLGELFLALRREFHEQHGNPLGLLYNVYCDGDTKIAPALSL